MDIFKTSRKKELLKAHPETDATRNRNTCRSADYSWGPQREFAHMRIHYGSSHGITGDSQSVIQLMPIDDAITEASTLQAQYYQYNNETKEINDIFYKYYLLDAYADEYLHASSQPESDDMKDDLADELAESAAAEVMTTQEEPEGSEEDDGTAEQFAQFCHSERAQILGLKEQLDATPDLPVPEYYREVITLTQEQLTADAIKSAAIQKLIHFKKMIEILENKMKTIEDFVLKNLSTLENGDLTLQVPNDLLYNALNHYTLPVLLQSMLVYYDEILNLRTLLSLPPSEDEFLTNLRELIQQPIIIYPFSADNHGGPGPVKLTLSNGSKIVVKFRFGQADVLFTEMLGAINRLEGTHDLPYYQQRSLDNRYLISEYVEGMTVPLGGTILDYMKNEPAAAKKKFLKLEYVSRMTGLTDMHSENYKGLDGTIYPIDLESYNPASATGFLDSLSRHISNGEKLTFLRAAGLTSIEDPEQLYTDSIASQLFAPDKLAEIKQIIDEVRRNIYMTVKRFVPVPTFSFLNIWAEDESVRAASLFTLLKDALDGSFDYNPSKLKELCSKILDNPPGYVPMFLIQGNCLYYNSIDENNLVGTKAG